MRHRLLAIPILFALAVPAAAEDAGFEHETDAQVSCDQPKLPDELAQLCAGLSGSYADAMSHPAEIKGSGRAPVKAAGKPAVTYEFTGRGLAAKKIDRAREPFLTPEERGVGLRLKATGAPVQFSTEMVQPGAGDDTLINWELRTEQATGPSGLFYGATTGGTYNGESGTENITGFAGLRATAKPADNVQIGAEVAPRAGLFDLSAPDPSIWIEPKFTAKSNLGRLGESDFVGSINADAGYNIPLEGDPSAWGGIRFTVKPK